MTPTGPGSQASSPAQRIIDLLTRRGPLSTAELVHALGVTTTAVRQQVNRLAAEGWLVRTRRTHGPGRPADVFAISAQTRRQFGARNDELSRLLIEEILNVEGPSRGRSILRRVGKRMAQNERPAVGEGPTADRLRRLADRMTRDGMVVETNGSPDHPRLTVFTCPYHGLAEEHREVCDMERETFSTLLGGPVQLEQCVLDGHTRCEFSVRSRPRRTGKL